jgi:hypothetical protein
MIGISAAAILRGLARPPMRQLRDEL